jgi:anti-sigma regulatory factor (Ser/Thr protein kinase)
VSQGSLLLKMELLSNPDMLCAVRGALGQLTERLGFPEPECRAIVLAVDEALTNIIRHAYRGVASRPIEASFRRILVSRDGRLREALEILLEDRGVTVDRAKLCGRALEDVKPGGLGLHFIHQSMDKVEFRRKIGRNQVRLVKFFHVPELHKGS